MGNIFQLFIIVRFSLKDLEKEYAKTEDVINAVQSVVQIVGEVMKQLDTDRCKYSEFILHRRTYIHIVFFVKASSGPRYIDSYRPTLPVAAWLFP